MRMRAGRKAGLFLPLAVVVVLIVSMGYFLLHKAMTYPENRWTRLIEKCTKVAIQAREMSEQGMIHAPINECQAIGIFPATISGGFGIGAEYGQGIIMVRNGDGWSSPAVFTVAGGSFGWQIGAQSTDVILFFMSKPSVDAILRGKLRLGADVSIAAGPIGRNASLSTDAQFRGGILSYSISKGLIAGAKLEAGIILENWKANRELYGARLSAREILLEGKAQMPKAAYGFMTALEPDNPLARFLKRFRLMK